MTHIRINKCRIPVPKKKFWVADSKKLDYFPYTVQTKVKKLPLVGDEYFHPGK